MKMTWFKKLGWLYVPVHVAGYLLTLLAIGSMVPACITILRNEHPVSDDLFYLFIYISCTAFWWKWVAEKTSN